jgi:hypothetical protein
VVSTPTQVLPTDTSRPSATNTPTVIPTSTNIPGSDAPFAVDTFQLQINSVDLGSAMFAPAGMAEDETVLTIEIKVLSGDPEIVSTAEGEFDVWVTNENGRKNSTRAATATMTEDGAIHTIQWLFGVAKSSKEIYLHFPNGMIIDLTPLLP